MRCTVATGRWPSPCRENSSGCRSRGSFLASARPRLRLGHRQWYAAPRNAARRASRPRAAPQSAAAMCLLSPLQAWLVRHFLVLTAVPAGQYDPGSQSQRLRRLPAHRQRLKFGTLIIAQYQGRKSLDRNHILRRCSSPHFWHGDANLLHSRRLQTCNSEHWILTPLGIGIILVARAQGAAAELQRPRHGQPERDTRPQVRSRWFRPLRALRRAEDGGCGALIETGAAAGVISTATSACHPARTPYRFWSRSRR